MSLDQPAAGEALWRLYDATGVRPEWLVPVLAYESGLDPSVPNGQGFPYYGLNQISGDWLAQIGVSPSDYLTWPASRQISTVVEPYLAAAEQTYGPLRSGIRVYQAHLWPKSLQYARALDDTILAAPSGPYEANKVFDTQNRGRITPRDLGNTIAREMAQPYVQRALSDTYALRPDERMTDAAFGRDFGMSSQGKALLAGLGIVGLSAAAAWWLASPGEQPVRRRRPALAAENPASERRPPMRIQSLLFRRAAGWTPARAKAWARSHGYKSRDMDVTDDFVHLTQRSAASMGVVRTKNFGRGILARVGR